MTDCDPSLSLTFRPFLGSLTVEACSTDPQLRDTCMHQKVHPSPSSVTSSTNKPVNVALQEYLPLGRFNELEAKNFEALKSELRGSIQKGVDFVHKSETSSLFTTEAFATKHAELTALIYEPGL